MTADMITPQEMFRSCSRATEWLLIIDDCRLEKGALPLTINDAYLNDVNKRANGTFQSNKKASLPKAPLPAVIDSSIIQRVDESKRIFLPVVNKNQFVADISGLAIPMLYEFINTKKIKIVDMIQSHRRCVLSHKRFIHFADFSTIADVLKLANLYLYIYRGYKSKFVDLNLSDYDWLSPDVIDELLRRMGSHISATNSEYEVEIGNYRVDAVNNDTNTVWEIKCKYHITDHDITQLTRYAQADEYKRRYRLLNLLTKEIIKLNIDNGLLLANSHCALGSNNNHGGGSVSETEMSVR